MEFVHDVILVQSRAVHGYTSVGSEASLDANDTEVDPHDRHILSLRLNFGHANVSLPTAPMR